MSDHDAPDGTLRVLENLRYAGPVEAPHLTPTPPAVAFYDTSTLDGTVVALGKQFRNTRGPWSEQADSSFSRHVIVTSSKIYLLDEDNAFRLTEVYDFGSNDTSRKAQFAQLAETIIIAVTAAGVPEFLLQLRDDRCFSFNGPSLPEIGAVVTTTADADALPQGVYAYRYAYELIDGSITAVSDVRILDASANALNKVDFHVLRIIGQTDDWDKLLRRIVVYMTAVSEEPSPGDNAHLSGLMNGEFFKIVTLDVKPGATAQFADTNEAILAGESLIDTNLYQHRIFASAVFAYNRELLLGDVVYDFSAPLLLGALKTPAGAGAPYITGPSSARFSFGDGDRQYWEVRVDQGYIKTITVVVPNFQYQIQRFNGTTWDTVGCPGPDTDYNDAGGANSYSRMRVAVIEIGASPSGQVQQLTINATSDLDFAAQPLQVNVRAT